MTKNSIFPSAGYYERYINLVPQNNLLDALQFSYQQLAGLNLEMYHRIGLKVYQENKWTISDIFQHLLDTERIMAYRALRFARQDKTELPGYEDNDYAQSAKASTRSLEEILHELALVKQANIALFKSFDEEMLLRTGVANGNELSVLALGFLLPGHQIHHLNVITERYEPLIY